MKEFLDADNFPESVLVVVAHPDDIDFGMAGTIARFTDAGTHVSYRLATSGEAGPPEDMPRSEVAAMREMEQRKAAEVVGVSDVEFLGLPDGHLEPNLALRREITRAIRSVRPHLVLTQSPERRYDRLFGSHPDHLAVGEATIGAVYPDSRNPHAHPELLADGYEPHRVSEVWVAGLEPLDVFIDIEPVFERKVEALSSHVSQTASFDRAEMLAKWARETATRLGFSEDTVVEAFRRINAG